MSLEDVDFVQIFNLEQIKPYMNSLAAAYQSVYTSPPYNEHFYPYEAQSIISYHVSSNNQITILALKDQQVIGFGLACPVHRYPEITRQIRGLLPTKYTYYLTELGVLAKWRRKGIGRHLTEEQIKLIDPRYQHVVLRTSQNQDAAHQMYTTMGFEDMGVYMEISSRRVDGSTRNDRRLFLSRLLQS